MLEGLKDWTSSRSGGLQQFADDALVQDCLASRRQCSLGFKSRIIVDLRRDSGQDMLQGVQSLGSLVEGVLDGLLLGRGKLFDDFP